MSHPYHHAVSSAKKFGGVPDDYLKIHQWFDQTKAHIADARHRMILHNSFGIFLLEQVFGVTITNSNGKAIPVRLIGEQHVLEDMGRILSVDECFKSMKLEGWMSKHAAQLSLEKYLAEKENIS